MVVVHQAAAVIADTKVHLLVQCMKGSMFVWLGSTPHLSNLALTMPGRGTSTLLLGDHADQTAASMAMRLGMCFEYTNLHKLILLSPTLWCADVCLNLTGARPSGASRWGRAVHSGRVRCIAADRTSGRPLVLVLGNIVGSHIL